MHSILYLRQAAFNFTPASMIVSQITDHRVGTLHEIRVIRSNLWRYLVSTSHLPASKCNTCRSGLSRTVLSYNSNKIMMTSSNGDIFRVTGPLCGEFTGHRWIPRTKAIDAELCMQKNERYIRMGKQYKFDSTRNNTHMHTLHWNLHQYFRPRSYRPYMRINLLRPNDAYMLHQPRPSLVHIMVCRLFGSTLWAGCTGDPLHNLTEPYTIHNHAAHHRQSHSPVARLRSAGLYLVRFCYVEGHPWYCVQTHYSHTWSV